ncbi:hypothetical protein QRX50_12520 [Amycolatopsis carbonis]|uniref:PPE family protein n=1 Tax=Amycolatopsis carbonis TaxID=715471 RepID=A0A9Y2MYC4_9PSEU|nr:hypothetical protein [Amycolatopsis sp. 2-15]WIX81518.1 hypothetical protein QRX50_12520 [Amycolatopsis sp. 2-15]
MSESHRAQHQQSAGDFYAQTQLKLQRNAARFGSEDRANAEKGITAETEKEASSYSVTQGDQLLQGQVTRSGAPAPGQNYAAQSHEDLYNMVHVGLDFREINERSTVANVYGNWLADASNAFRDAASTAGASWQGAAASQANSFFQNTASHTEQTGNAMQLISNRYSQQSAAADYAQKNMPEPTGFNQQAEMDKATKQLSGGDPAAAAQTMTALAAKQQQADAAHQQAVQVMEGLDNTYHETATTQPTFAPPPAPGGSDDSTRASSAQPGAGLGAHAGALNSGSGGFGAPGGGAPGGGTGGPAGFSGNAYAPPGAGSSTGAGAFGGPGGTGGGGFRPPAGGGGFGRLSPDALAFGGGPGGAGGAGEETLRGGRAGGGTGRTGGGFAGSRVSGGGATAKPGEGPGSGKGAGERLERGATAAANAGKAGKAGAGGAAGAAGAGKKKEDDKEHKNKLPNQEDPDEVFEVRPERGPDGEKITPPVIGG